MTEATTPPPGQPSDPARVPRVPPSPGGAPPGTAQEQQDRPLQPEDFPGIYLIVAGVVIAVLAPLFGFLGGSMVGTDDAREPVQPLVLWLTGGIVLGGLGALVAFLGGIRLVRHRRAERAGQPR